MVDLFIVSMVFVAVFVSYILIKSEIGHRKFVRAYQDHLKRQILAEMESGVNENCMQ